MKQTKPIPTASGSSGVGDNEGLAMDVYSGVRWSAVAKYGSQGAQMVTSIIVARIVAPEAFGLMGMAVVITGFLSVFRSFGFGAALVQRKAINQSLLSSVLFVNMALGSVIAAMLLAGGPLFSWMYGDNRVGPIIAALSITFLISAPALVPAALLQRRLAFQQLAWIDISVAIVGGVSAIALALSGWSVWALVWSSIAGAAVRTPLLFVASRWRPGWLFSWAEVRSVLSFGANLTGFSIFNYFARNADNLIIGSFLGATPLGYYSLAYRILLFPRDVMTAILMRVLFPVFSRMQDDDERLKATYLRVCGAIAFVTFPMMMGMFVVASPFVQVVLGEKWMPAVPLILVFAPLGMLQSIGATVGQLFLAKGRADLMARWGTIRGLLIVMSFLLGVRYGVTGVAAAYTIVIAVTWLPFVGLALHLVKHMRLIDLGKCLLPHGENAAVMAIAVLLARKFLANVGMSEAMILCICVPTGVVIYIALVAVRRTREVNEFFRLVPGLDRFVVLHDTRG